MPMIYLSPSTQDWNMYVTGSGSEEYNMNLLADALVPYLVSNGIRYRRNSPEMTAASSIREANSGQYESLPGASLQRRAGGALWRGAGHHCLLLSGQCQWTAGGRS